MTQTQPEHTDFPLVHTLFLTLAGRLSVSFPSIWTLTSSVSDFACPTCSLHRIHPHAIHRPVDLLPFYLLHSLLILGLACSAKSEPCSFPLLSSTCLLSVLMLLLQPLPFSPRIQLTGQPEYTLHRYWVCNPLLHTLVTYDAAKREKITKSTGRLHTQPLFCFILFKLLIFVCSVCSPAPLSPPRYNTPAHQAILPTSSSGLPALLPISAFAMLPQHPYVF